MSRIFASYSMQDKPVATAALKKWLDQQDDPGEVLNADVRISSGRDMREVIRKRIEASDSFVVVWTNRAAESPWVLYELGLAHALGLPITILLAGGDREAIPEEFQEGRIVELERPAKIDRALARRHIRERVRRKVMGKEAPPRLAVFRSLKNIYAQVIDDASGQTIVSASSMEKDAIKKTTNASAAEVVGQLIAKKALDKGITKVVFNRGGYLNRGKIKVLADAARENGLEF